jgi:hypothetical protein
MPYLHLHRGKCTFYSLFAWKTTPVFGIARIKEELTWPAASFQLLGTGWKCDLELEE